MPAKRFAFAALFLSIFNTSLQAQWWKVETSGLDTNLRSVSAAYTADETGTRLPVVWASGSNGVILKSIDKGLLKTFSKMGISTLQSYRGAQLGTPLPRM